MNNRDSTNVRGLLGQLFFESVFGETQLRGSIWGIDRGHMKYILIYVLFFYVYSRYIFRFAHHGFQWWNRTWSMIVTVQLF